MKKVLFIHHNTISVGAGLSALQIVGNIPQKSYDITVCMPDGEGDLASKFEAMGVKVRNEIPCTCTYTHVSGYHYNVFSISHIHNVFDLLRAKKTIENVIEEEKPDIVIVNSMTLFWIGKIAKRAGAKTVCFDRETYCHGMFGVRTRYIKSKLNRDFDKIVFLSEYDMMQTGKNFDKYVKITDKVDEKLYCQLNKDEERKALDLPMNEKLILYVGGMSKLKGIDVALKMITEMQVEAKLIILQYAEPCEAQKGIRGIRQGIRRKRNEDIEYWSENYIKANNLNRLLILRGRTDAVEKYFAASDVIIFPSQEPHQARPIFEAGISKRPIIVSDYENTREFLDNTCGWCVKKEDIQLWAQTCDGILTNEVETEKRVEKNYSKVRLNNTIEMLQNEIELLLYSL